MNGIRYLRLHASCNLLIGTSRNSCSKLSFGKNSVNGFIYRGLHRSTIRNTVNDDKSTEMANKRKRDFHDGPDLADFIKSNISKSKRSQINSIKSFDTGTLLFSNGRSVYFEIYGCQMNVNDIEVVWSILKKHGYKRTESIHRADVVLLMTCAIREGAEDKVWNKLDILKGIKSKRKKNSLKIGILGCMAERLKKKIFERNNAIDVIAGPDSYKDLPRLLAVTEDHETAINVMLSADETYADIMPVRLNPETKTAFVTIMRGCDNMCTYCIVPFTRGRERSRPIASILEEIRQLSDQGVKEVTLLGQNVNSYQDHSESNFYDNVKTPTNLAKGFKTVYKSKLGGLRFSDLLDKVSRIDPEMRIRFTSPHPKDFPDEVLHLIAERSNICQQLHMPAQSGNSNVLERMRRGYTREAYLELVEHIRDIIPNISLSSDFIAGFCGETEEEFQDTLSLMEAVQFNKAYLFAYSMREKTTAYHRLIDDVPDSVKKLRVQKMIQIFKGQAEKLNRQQIGSQQLVLIEGEGRKGDGSLVGRNDGNIRVVIPKGMVPAHRLGTDSKPIMPGNYVVVQIYGSNMNSLMGVPLYHSTLSAYAPEIENSVQCQERVRPTA